MTPLANGQIVLWQGGSLWIFQVPAEPGTRQRTDFHAHHAIQVTLALDGAFKLHTNDGVLAGPALIVAPDIQHAFEPKGLIALLFIEPESAAGRSLIRARLADAPVAAVPEDIFSDLRAELGAAYLQAGRDGEPLRAIGRAFVTRLAGGADPAAPDARVQESLAWASANLDRRLGIADAAERVGLSADRMSHLFVEQTGLPFRTYLLWLRLSRAVERYAQGSSLTEAAHEAGFADSAHFSRTFRRMFGVAAAELRLS